MGCRLLPALLVLAVSPSLHAETVYVSNEKDNSISIVDGQSLEVVKTIPVGQRPRGILLSADRKELLICASDDDTVQVLDLGSQQIVRTLPSGPDPEQFTLSSQGDRLYI